MSATARQEREMKMKYERVKATSQDPLELLRAHALTKGCIGIKSIARQFKRIDEDGNHQIELREFKQAIHRSGIDLDPEQINDLFHRIDTGNTGTIVFDEFLVAIRPPLSKHRESLIRQAFQKIDRTQTGVITVEDLRGVYCGKKHPKYLAGEWTEDQVFMHWLGTFDQDKDGEVDEDEFMHYYEGVSASVDSEAYFDLMMRQAWKL